jgi:hypothetical protein
MDEYYPIPYFIPEERVSPLYPLLPFKDHVLLKFSCFACEIWHEDLHSLWNWTCSCTGYDLHLNGRSHALNDPLVVKLVSISMSHLNKEIQFCLFRRAVSPESIKRPVICALPRDALIKSNFRHQNGIRETRVVLQNK